MRSVIHCVPCHSSAMSVAVRRGRKAAWSSALPYARSIREVESVTLTGQSRPNSDWAKRYDRAYFTVCGTGPGQPSTPGRWDMAARPNREKASCSICR